MSSIRMPSSLLLACGLLWLAGCGKADSMPATADSPRPAGPVSPADRDFAARCGQLDVVTCVGFDTKDDFSVGSGGTQGAYGTNAGILPVGNDYSRAVRDTSVSASGKASLKFVVPSNSAANSSGSYFTNFSKDLSVQFGGGQEFYVQWRQRFSPDYLSNVYTGGGGFKQVIVGTGDQNGTNYSSCSSLELPVQNYRQRGFPVMYNSCTGSASHNAYDAFYEPMGANDFKLQNGRAAPYCLYSQSTSGYFPPTGNCFTYVPNEWMTFQIQVRIGTREGDEFKGSQVRLWAAREGKPSELIIDWGPYNLSAGKPESRARFGKVWLLPYNTGKDPFQAHPTAYTWYDELIVSRSRIADPR